MAIDAARIINIIKAVTAPWAKVRKAEERERSRRYRRNEYLTRPYRETIKDVAWEVMAEAYRKASADGTLPATARQIMYAARPAILERTGKQDLDDAYFTQFLLPDYMTEHPKETATWDVVFDARGHFREPHTERVVDLGTLAVRQYLQEIKSHQPASVGVHVSGGDAHSTCGPTHRYGAVLFVEKEGFAPLFEKVRLAEKWDLSIMSTKGLSVTAARSLVDSLCATQAGVPLLVLHDFDKSGFSILGTLSRDTRRYTFRNDIQIVDLGLRLADVEAEGLSSEVVSYGKADPEDNLLENGATAEEVAFLCSPESSHFNGFVGQRVELNAFASDKLITWIERKLMQAGVKKVVPDEGTLRAAYLRALRAKRLQQEMDEVVERLGDLFASWEAPDDLDVLVREGLKADPTAAWDSIITDIAEESMEGER